MRPRSGDPYRHDNIMGKTRNLFVRRATDERSYVPLKSQVEYTTLATFINCKKVKRFAGAAQSVKVGWDVVGFDMSKAPARI